MIDEEYGVVDFGYVEEVSGGDTSIEAELLTMFLSQAEEIVAGLEEAKAARDGKTLAAVAHKAKSTVLSLGMQKAAEALVSLQQMGRNCAMEKKETLVEVDGLIKFCKLQLDKACDAVRERLQDGGIAGPSSE